MKIPKCQHKDKNNNNDCDKPRLKKGGNNTLYWKFCTDHQIEANLSKVRAEVQKDREGLQKAKESKKKTGTQRFYTSSAWRNCSRFVLLHYSDDNLMVHCSTSPNLEYHVTAKEIHCGHYHKADQHKATAFEFKNLCPQSYSDNIHFSGKPEVMAKWIEKTHGEGTLEWLDIKKNETLKLDKYTLDNISKHYLGLLNEELKKRGITNPWKK
jgi:hypothetical protein